MGCVWFKPLGLLIWLVRHRKKLDQQEIKDSIGWMYMPYTREAYFWEIEEIIRKMILSGGLIFLGQMPSLQLSVAMGLSIGFHQMHSIWRPHASKMIYFIQHICLSAVELVYITGMLLMLNEPVPEGLLFGASSGTVGLGFCGFSLALYTAFKKFVVLRKEDREYEKAESFRKNLKSHIEKLEDEYGIEHIDHVELSESENNKIRELIKNETETRSSTKVAPNDANVRNSKT